MGSPKIWWVFFHGKSMKILLKWMILRIIQRIHLKDPKLQAIMANLNSSRPVNLEAVSTCFNRGSDVLRMFYGFFTDVFRIFNLWIYLWMFVDVYRCLWMHMVHGLWWWCCCCCSSADLPNVRIWRARSVRWSWATCRQDGNELGMDQPMTIWLIWLGE